MFGKYGGFMAMILAVLGIVVYVTMFDSVLNALGDIWEYANLATFVALGTVVRIAPTVLLLGGVGLSGWAFVKGSQGAAGADPGGILRMVLGVLVIILFATLFSTILSSFYTLYGSANSTWIAFGTVVSILPTILFLAGVFAGASQVRSGFKARRSRRSLGRL